MPVHAASTLLEGRLGLKQVLIAGGALALLLVIKAWAGGRKNTWERDWAGKMILVIAKPNPITLQLLHSLLHLPSPPQVLFLPPLQSPLPPNLLTILHAIRTSSNALHPAAQLHCEPLPRTPRAVRDFVKLWGMNPAGTGEGGRRVDAIIWGDGWEVKEPLHWFKSRSGSKSGAGKIGKVDKAEDSDDISKEEDEQSWTHAEFRFHLLTALLPHLLKSPPERSIRLITLCSPFYAAAMPMLDLDLDSSASSSSPAGQEPKTSGGTPMRKNLSSTIVQAGLESWKSIVLWNHLQRVLNALASVSHSQSLSNSTKGVPVPIPIPSIEDPSIALPQEVDIDRQPQSQKEFEEEERRGGLKNITVESNVMALAVVMPPSRWGVLRPLFGLSGGGDVNISGLIIYLLLSPLIYLLTPSPTSSIQSILYALSAPVIYDADIAREKHVSQGFAARVPRGDGVRGGGLVRNCLSFSAPIIASRTDKYGQKVWEDLEKVVEERLKVVVEKEKERAAAAPGGGVGGKGGRGDEERQGKEEGGEGRDVYSCY